MEGKQFADAPESSAACTVSFAGSAVVVVVVSIASKVTLLVDFTRKASPVFKMDIGDFVDVLDTDEPDEDEAAVLSPPHTPPHPPPSHGPRQTNFPPPGLSEAPGCHYPMATPQLSNHFLSSAHWKRPGNSRRHMGHGSRSHC